MILWHIELHVLTERGVRSLMIAGAENKSHLLNEDVHRLVVWPHKRRRRSGTLVYIGQKNRCRFNQRNGTFNSGMLTIKAKGSLQSGSLV